MKISTILDQIDNGSVALPEFQRGYVWNRDQVRGLIQSLYRRYPVGMLLVWETQTETAPSRGDGPLSPGYVTLILDGQQRITTLYGLDRGKPPEFFEGNSQAFTGLYFNVETGGFAFYSPMKMQDNPLWVDVTEIFQKGAAEIAGRFFTSEKHKDNATTYLSRLNAVAGILDTDLHVEKVTGAHMTVDVVVEIFNRVNSGGTKLSKGDLALAKICASWPPARDELKKRLEKYRAAGFHFRIELLLRCITTVLTGQAFFSELAQVTPEQFRDGLDRAEKLLDKILNMIGARLGLDHDRVLGSRYSLPLMVRYLDQRGGTLSDPTEWDKLLYWYVNTFLWGRYAGSTESKLSQDLSVIRGEGGEPANVEGLIELLRRERGELNVHPSDFGGWSRGARFYPLLYLMSRVCGSKDWQSGLELKQSLLGKQARLHVHHIFPKALLYDAGYSMSEVNSLANFTFQTEETNIRLSDTPPAEYLAEIEAQDSEALDSHWMPRDRRLWEVANYLEFLEERRRLLADGANSFLSSLLHGSMPESAIAEESGTPSAISEPSESAEEKTLQDINRWVTDQGLPEGEMYYELSDEDTGEPLTILDLAWPEGLQLGLSEPVALLLDEGEETEEAANRAGYRFFTNEGEFKEYVQREILAMEPAE